MKRYFKVGLIALVAIALVLGFTARQMLSRGFSARDEPSRIEVVVARAMRGLATPATAKDLKDPLTSAPENLQMGLEHFADHCAVCHANNGSGNTMLGRNMYPKPPDLRLAQTQDLTDGEIYYIIQNGVRLTGMPAFGQPGRTDDEGSWQLVRFIRHLPKLTPAEEEKMKRLNPAPPKESELDDEFLSGEPAKPNRAKPPSDHKH